MTSSTKINKMLTSMQLPIQSLSRSPPKRGKLERPPPKKVAEETEVVTDGDAPAAPEGTAIGIERVEDVESFHPPTLPTILAKPGDKDVSSKPSPEVEVIPKTSSPGKEEETPDQPAEDKGIQNLSTESVVSSYIHLIPIRLELGEPQIFLEPCS